MTRIDALAEAETATTFHPAVTAILIQHEDYAGDLATVIGTIKNHYPRYWRRLKPLLGN